MSRELTPEEINAQAFDLAAQGYIGVSNKYRIICRIDQPDWLVKLAGHMGRSVADFYVIRGDKMTDSTGHWGEFYANRLSEDRREGIHPQVYRQLSRLMNLRRHDLKYAEGA